MLPAKLQQIAASATAAVIRTLPIRTQCHQPLAFVPVLSQIRNIKVVRPVLRCKFFGAPLRDITALQPSNIGIIFADAPAIARYLVPGLAETASAMVICLGLSCALSASARENSMLSSLTRVNSPGKPFTLSYIRRTVFYNTFARYPESHSNFGRKIRRRDFLKPDAGGMKWHSRRDQRGPNILQLGCRH